MQIESVSLKHAICSLISVVACTPQGVDYLTMYGLKVPLKVVDILKLKLDDCTDGSVAQRFCIAILQKMAYKDTVSLMIFEVNCAQWILGLLERSLKSKEIHSFCLDFGSALLANMFHNYSVLDKLEKTPNQLADLLARLLALLKENLPSSVLVHLLICLSYLSKERFSSVLEEVHFVEKISEFVEWYSSRHQSPSTNKTQVSERKTVLDLCAHMFHPKDQS